MSRRVLDFIHHKWVYALIFSACLGVVIPIAGQYISPGPSLVQDQQMIIGVSLGSGDLIESRIRIDDLSLGPCTDCATRLQFSVDRTDPEHTMLIAATGPWIKLLSKCRVWGAEKNDRVNLGDEVSEGASENSQEMRMQSLLHSIAVSEVRVVATVQFSGSSGTVACDLDSSELWNVDLPRYSASFPAKGIVFESSGQTPVASATRALETVIHHNAEQVLEFTAPLASNVGADRLEWRIQTGPNAYTVTDLDPDRKGVFGTFENSGVLVGLHSLSGSRTREARLFIAAVLLGVAGGALLQLFATSAKQFTSTSPKVRTEIDCPRSNDRPALKALFTVIAGALALRIFGRRNKRG